MSRTYDYRDIAVRYPLAEELRLPLVTDYWPEWRYITAVCVSPDNEFDMCRAVMPTDAELRAVASFHDEYCAHWYRDSYKAEMRKRPYDLDGGANGTVFGKNPDGSWRYRKFTWEHGPVPRRTETQLSLLQVMDRAHGVGTSWGSDRWPTWVAAHADVFGAMA